MGNKYKSPYILNNDECTTLKEWLFSRHNISYEDFRKKPKGIREKLKYEYYTETGIILDDNGQHINSKLLESERRESDELGKTGVLHLLFGCIAIIYGFYIIASQIGVDWLGVFILLLIFSCAACWVGNAFSQNFWRGITKVVLSIATGMYIEIINICVCISEYLEDSIIYTVSLGILFINCLISFWIARKVF